LDEIAGQAMRLEQTDPVSAAMAWRKALDLAPPDSPEAQHIRQRIGELVTQWQPPVQAGPAAATPVATGYTWPGSQEVPDAAGRYRHVRPPDPLPMALAKTIGSMLVAAVVYYYYPFHNLTISIGFVVLMLIHEMGHVIATRYYGMSASPPIFIPFLGALINLREQPKNALVESVVGMGGPLLGTVGAVACYIVALFCHGQLQLELMVVTQLAVMLNLFNLLPVPPLDGGRITAAISPWIWVLGLIGLGVLMYMGIGFNLFILALLLFYALPRITVTLRARGISQYYNISRRASWTMAALYLGLGLFLAFMFLHLGGLQMIERAMEQASA
jgi:Zn-dependent protease